MLFFEKMKAAAKLRKLQVSAGGILRKLNFVFAIFRLFVQYLSSAEELHFEENAKVQFLKKCFFFALVLFCVKAAKSKFDTFCSFLHHLATLNFPIWRQPSFGVQLRMTYFRERQIAYWKKRGSVFLLLSSSSIFVNLGHFQKDFLPRKFVWVWGCLLSPNLQAAVVETKRNMPGT